MKTKKELYFPFKEYQGNDILFSFSDLPEIKKKLCCPKCLKSLIKKKNCFYWRSTEQKHFSGLVCETCNSLWENPFDSWSVQMTNITFVNKE